MPIFMDLHIVPGVKAKEAAEAHRKDILIEEMYGCKCLTYWVDEARGHVFCLIDAPSKEAVETMHAKVHRLEPHKIIEVQSYLMEPFLGRVSDSKEVQTTADGLPFNNDPTFRILMVTTVIDPVLLQQGLGREKADELIDKYYTVVREELTNYDGVEVQNRGHGFIISFRSAGKAVSCAMAIHQKLKNKNKKRIRFRIAIHAGEPASANEQIIGEIIQLGERICFIAEDFSIGISAQVRELIAKDLQQSKNTVFTLWPKDEEFLNSLFDALEENWQNAHFSTTDYCQSMAMSKSQLYRKTSALCQCSPKGLLQQFRLDKARQLLKMGKENISQVTYNVGFNSPSYFTKCFKKEYGMAPNAYLDMLH